MQTISFIFLTSLFLDQPPVNTVCICEKARIHDGWCDVCGFGWVAGLKIPSKLLFTTIDHGHEVNLQFMRCESCRQAAKSDSFCPLCHFGYYKNKVYFSPFTHCLARGIRMSRSEITCPTCLRNMEEGGWCESCKRGMFGNVATTEREKFDEVVAAFRRLKLGLAYLEKCELCGIAMYANGMCPKHHLVYEGGVGKPGE